MGTFAQRGLAASSLNHCGLTGSHPSHRRHPAASFYVGRPYSATIPSIRDASPRTWGFPMRAWLLHRRCQARCCLGPRGAGNHLPIAQFPFRLRPLSKDRHIPKIHCFSGLRGRFRAHTLHLARLAYLLSQKIHYRAVGLTLPGKA